MRTCWAKNVFHPWTQVIPATGKGAAHTLAQDLWNL